MQVKLQMYGALIYLYRAATGRRRDWGCRECRPEGLDDSDAFVSEVCWHYYVNEMTQAEVAVAARRHAAQGEPGDPEGQVARDGEGADRIAVPGAHRAAAAAAVTSSASRGRWSRPASRDAYDYHVPAGAALASYMEAEPQGAAWKSVGVSWGHDAAERHRPPAAAGRIPDLEIVSMIGGREHRRVVQLLRDRLGIRRAARVEVLAARRADLPAGGGGPGALPVGASASISASAGARRGDPGRGRHLVALLPDRDGLPEAVPSRGARGDGRGGRRARPLPRRGGERRAASAGRADGGGRASTRCGRSRRRSSRPQGRTRSASSAPPPGGGSSTR